MRILISNTMIIIDMGTASKRKGQEYDGEAWTPMHDSLYFWVSDNREVVLNEAIAPIIEKNTTHPIKEILISKFEGELERARYSGSRPDINIILKVTLDRHVVAHTGKDDRGSHVVIQCKACDGESKYALEHWNNDETRIKIYDEFIRDYHTYYIPVHIELKPQIEGYFGSTLAQCQRHARLPYIERENYRWQGLRKASQEYGKYVLNRGGDRAVWPFVLVISPDSSADKYLQDQGFYIYHPKTWVYLSDIEVEKLTPLMKRLRQTIQENETDVNIPQMREMLYEIYKKLGQKVSAENISLDTFVN